MEPRPDRTRELFAAALELPAAERRRWLEHACAGDAALLARVQELLAAHERAGSFLADPGAEVRRAATAAGDEQPGATIGAYKLLENIGEGGFGTVWMAEQRQPVRRLVALKLLKAGMDSKQAVARFEQERQALALMTHPNIAQVFDAGTTERGRPFFVMELVKGVPITDYCEREKLPVRARLDLFVQVCRAVQHAHGKGLIHRDLKPRNVLVATADARPLAKVIDFGIAKATGARLTEKTLFTEHHAMVGTLEYMSPEQAEGLLDVDTRSDVYSLGALLYELLTGSTPFDSKQLVAHGYAEILRVLREVEPQRPSVRVSSRGAAGWAGGAVAKAQSDGRELFGVLKGDLDWVVMKALEKDRGRRYASADGLAEDVERYLAGEAVRAVPPSAGYRVRKFVRKNKALVVGLTAVGSALLLGVVGTTWGMLEADRNRLVAERNQVHLRAAARKATTTLGDVLGGGNELSLSVSGLEGRDLPASGPEQDQAKILVSFDALAEKVRDQLESLELEAYRANLNASVASAKAELPVLAATALARCAEQHRGWEWHYVAALSAEAARVLERHMGDGELWDVARDGRQIVALSDTGMLSVIRTGSWTREVEQLLEPRDVEFVGITAGEQVVLGSKAAVTLLGLPTCALVRSLDVPGDRSWYWSPDRRLVAQIHDDQGAANDDSVTFWDVTTGRAIVQASLPSADDPSYSHDGRFVACRGGGKTLIWRSSDGSLALEVDDHLELNPHGSLSCSRRCLVVDPSAATVHAWATVTEHEVVSYLGADHVVLEHRGERTIEIRSIVDGAMVPLPAGARSRPSMGIVAVTPDRARLYGWWTEAVSGVSLVTGEELPAEQFMWWHDPVLTADGKWWIGIDSQHRRLMAMGARPPRYTSPRSEPIGALASSVGAFGRRTIGYSRTRRHVLDEDTAAHVESPVGEPAVDLVVGCQGGQRFLVWRSGELMLCDAPATQSWTKLADTSDAHAIALSHDGSIAAACGAKTVSVWEAKAGGTSHRGSIGQSLAEGVCVLAVESGWVAVATGNTVRLLPTAATGAPIDYVVDDGTVTALAFRNEGSHLLVGTSSGEALILQVTDLTVVARLRGHDGAITALAWSPTGDRVFSAGVDGTVRVWRSRSPTIEGVELLSLIEPDISGKPTCLLFPPDGERLICGYDDGAIRVWDSVPWSERVDRRNAASPK